MKGTLWLTWRQQRAVILTGLLLLAACAAWTVYERAGMTDTIASEHLRLCKGWNGGCDTPPVIALIARYAGPIKWLGSLSTAFPVLVGVFWGAPLLGRELESGTFKLTFSQDAGPLRWFAARFGVAAVCSLLGSAVLAALVAWWWAPIANTLNGPYWYDGYLFNGTGPAAVACALFGLCAGTAAGLLTRRAVSAMAVTLVVVAGVRLLLDAVRPMWIAPQVRTSAGTTPKQLIGSALSAGRWGYVTPSGGHASIDDCLDSGAELKRCMAQHGYVGRFYQAYPSGDFWTFQGIETALYLVLALALAALVVRRLSRPGLAAAESWRRRPAPAALSVG